MEEDTLTVSDDFARDTHTASVAASKGEVVSHAAPLFQHGQEPVGPRSPPGFEAYKDNENARGLVGLIEDTIKAIKAEVDALTAYEGAS